MVRWSAPAKKDLKQIYDYIARDSKYYAKNVVQNIVARSESLKDCPKMGRIVPETDDSNVRELFIYSYRLIYEILPDGITVLAIIYGKRDLSVINRSELSR